MTVYAEQHTQEVPVPAEQRRRPVLSESEAAELAASGIRIEEHFGAPQDIEWARANGHFFIVQARPITALPEVEAPPPTDWSVPEPTAMYVRASIVEQLPDPLSPLFADMIDGAVTRSLQSMFRELLNEDLIHDTDVGLPTINGYAYYRYDRSGMIRLLWKTPKALREAFGRGGTLQARWRTTRIRSIAGSSPIGPHAISASSVPMSCLLAFRSWWRRPEYYTAADDHPGGVRERCSWPRSTTQ